MKKALLTVLTAVFVLASTEAGACTTAVVGAGASESGRPMLWKQRDTGNPFNVLVHIPAADGRYAYTFAVPVSNTAAAGYAGSDVTLCLYAVGHEGEDLRHYRVLSLAAGSATTLTVTFSDLAPATSYTFLLRCPWAVQSQLSFTTPTPTGITTFAPAPAKQASPWYDLSGRPARDASRGLLIQKGKKIWLTN